MTDADIITLSPLRRIRMGQLFRPAPANPLRVVIFRREVQRLVAAGALAWGNRSRSFVVRTGGAA
jgi:hypothetical protein